PRGTPETGAGTGRFARSPGDTRGRLDARGSLVAGRSRAASRDELAEGPAARRGAPHDRAAHEAEGGAPEPADSRGTGDGTPAVQAPRLFDYCGREHRARPGDRPAQ